MKKLFFIALVFAAAIPAKATLFTFDLLGRSGAGMRFDNENPSASGSATGNEVGAGILYDDASNLITINVGWGSGAGFTDLTGAVTVAHIHQAADALFTTNGGVIVNLHTLPGYNSSATNGGWNNTQATLSAAQETALFSGFLYLNAHTTTNPGGEIRGNLVNPIAIPEPSVAGLLALSGCGMLLRRRRA